MLSARMNVARESKRYVRFTDADGARLAVVRPHVEPHFARIAQEFYERIREHEEAHAVFVDEDQIGRLQRSMVAWLERVFGGVYDDAYFDKTEQIGRVHVNVGLPQRYMPLAMALIRTSLVRVVFEAQPKEEAIETLDALGRLLDLDLAIMLESYRSHMEARVARVTRAPQARLTRLEENCLEAIDRAPLLVVGLDRDDGIVVFNREAERVSGWARDEALERVFGELLLPDEARASRAQLGDGVAVEIPLLTRAGKLRAVEWQPVRSQNEVVALFLFGFDVTDERIERERHQQQKRLAALGTLAAGLAHEIRNPLNGAKLHVAFLDRALRGSGTPEVLDAVKVVGDELGRLARLVTDFLDYAQPRPVTRARTHVQALCARAIQVLRPTARQHQIELRTEMPKSDLVLEADAPRLEQVLLNLLHNAIEAIGPSGGVVVVRARREPQAVVLEVEDDGPGLPPGDAPLFDAFFSTKANGTGLGLAIVHRIVTDHGGTIDVERRDDRTVFRLRLPLTLRETDE